MKTGILIAALIGTALALPTPEERRARRQEARQARINRKTSPPQNLTAAAVQGPQNVNVQYSSNWAGAVLIGSGFTSVTGTITVPTPKEPSGGSSSTTYSASAWVGIDGDTCASAILQTGVDFNVEGSSVSYDAWYEWYPDYAYDFSGFSISAGNQIKMTVTATSKTAGVATLSNLSTGKSVSHTFSNEGSEGSLCETNAEWIIEDFEEGSSLVPFANFGTVTFSSASAVESGRTVTPSGATIFDIQQNGKTLTSCSAGSSVTCSYV